MSEKMCYIKLKGKFCNISVICAHAPTEENEDLIKDEFYDELTRTLHKLSNHYRKIVLWDFKGSDGTFYPNVGDSLYTEENNNGV
jgi:hypothetical protein